jgi:hypothetical protein
MEMSGAINTGQAYSLEGANMTPPSDPLYLKIARVKAKEMR